MVSSSFEGAFFVNVVIIAVLIYIKTLYKSSTMSSYVSLSLFSFVFITQLILNSTTSFYSLGEWETISSLHIPVTQHYSVFNAENNTAFVSGGLVSDTEAIHTVQEVKFSLSLFEPSNSNITHINMSSATTLLNTLMIEELGFTYNLSDWYTVSQSAGYYDNSMFVVQPIYDGDIDGIYFIKCDLYSFTCELSSDILLPSLEPTVTQYEHYLFVSGGKIGSEISKNINV